MPFLEIHKGCLDGKGKIQGQNGHYRENVGELY